MKETCLFPSRIYCSIDSTGKRLVDILCYREINGAGNCWTETLGFVFSGGSIHWASALCHVQDTHYLVSLLTQSFKVGITWGTVAQRWKLLANVWLQCSLSFYCTQLSPGSRVRAAEVTGTWEVGVSLTWPAMVSSLWVTPESAEILGAGETSDRFLHGWAIGGSEITGHFPGGWSASWEL